jgi:hypothetical protein
VGGGGGGTKIRIRIIKITVLTDSTHTNDLAKTLEVKNQKKSVKSKMQYKGDGTFQENSEKIVPKVWHQSL